MELVDWGVSHTTLEDVFLSLAKEDDGSGGKRKRRDMFKVGLPAHSNHIAIT